MGGRTVHLSLDLQVDGGSLSGYVGSAGGERRAIWGRLGLLGAIERLIADDPEAPEAVRAALFGEPLYLPAARRRPFSSAGCRCTLLVTGAESRGSYLVMEASLPPGTPCRPHVHRREDLAVVLIEGEARFRLDDTTGRMGAGDFVNAPRGTNHCFWNEGTAPARLLVTATPAGLEGLVTEASTVHAGDDEMARCDEVAARYGIHTEVPIR